MSEPNRHGVPEKTWAQWSEPERLAFNIMQDAETVLLLYGNGTVESLGILQVHGT